MNQICFFKKKHIYIFKVKINESLVFLARMQNFVAHSFLDIDSESLEILESYQICCLVLSYAIQCLLFQRYILIINHVMDFCINLSSFFIREESTDPLLIPLIRLARCNMNDTLSGQVNDMNLRKNKVQYVLRSRWVEILKDIEIIRRNNESIVRIIKLK